MTSRICEVWQIYRSFQGWTSSKGQPLPHYYDSMSQASSETFPDVKLPNGCTWGEEWSIDISKSYGDCEGNDGWMYGPSFDKLLESIISRNANGVANSKSNVRCRRWLRKMNCTSSKAERAVLAKLQSLCARCELYTSICNEKDFIHTDLLDYERQRSAIHSMIAEDVINRIKKDITSIRDLSSRLFDMKNYCTMRAAADKEYSKKLMELSSTYRVNPTKRDAHEDSFCDNEEECERKDTESDPNEHTPRSILSERSESSEASNLLFPETKLLASIDLVNYEFCERYSKLSSLLSSVMMEDLDSLIVQSQQVYHSYNTHITSEYGLYTSKRDQIKQVVMSMDGCLKVVQDMNQNDIQRIRDETDAYNFNANKCPSSTVNDLYAMLRVKYPANEDLWILIYMYRKGVYDTTSILSSFLQMAKSVKLLAMKLMNQCYAVITMIAKFLADEQAKIWIDCGEKLLKCIKSSENQKDSNGLKSSGRRYSLPDPPPSPNPKSFYKEEGEVVHNQLIALLEDLPVCPKVILRETVEVTAIEGLAQGKETIIDLDWFTCQLVLTTDGYVHILKPSGFERPIRSFNIKACDVNIEAAGFALDRVTNCVSIRPWTVNQTSSNDPMNQAAPRNKSPQNNSNNGSPDFNRYLLNRGIESSAGLLVFFSSPKMAEKLFHAILDLSPLIQLQHPDQPMPLPQEIGLSSQLFRENHDGMALQSSASLYGLIDEHDKEALLMIDIAYGDLSIAFKPVRSILNDEDEDDDLNESENILQQNEEEIFNSLSPSNIMTDSLERRDDSLSQETENTAMTPLEGPADEEDDVKDQTVDAIDEADEGDRVIAVEDPIDEAADDDEEVKADPIEAVHGVHPVEIDRVEGDIDLDDAIDLHEAAIDKETNKSSHESDPSDLLAHTALSNDSNKFTIEEIESIDSDQSQSIEMESEEEISQSSQSKAVFDPLKKDNVVDAADSTDNEANRSSQSTATSNLTADSSIQRDSSKDISEPIYYEGNRPNKSSTLRNPSELSSVDASSSIPVRQSLSFDPRPHDPISIDQTMAMATHLTELERSKDLSSSLRLSRDYFIDTNIDLNLPIVEEEDKDDASDGDQFNEFLFSQIDLAASPQGIMPSMSQLDAIEDQFSPTMSEVNQAIAALTYLKRQQLAKEGKEMAFEEEAFDPEGLIEPSHDQQELNPSSESINASNPSKRRNRLFMDFEGISPRTMAILQYHNLYDSIYATAAAAHGIDMTRFLERHYKAPPKIIPDDNDPSQPFAKRNTQPVRQYQEGLEKEKKRGLQRMSSMRVHHAAMSRLLKEFKGVGGNTSQELVKELGMKWSQALQDDMNENEK